MVRSRAQLLPEFTAELEEIRTNGITPDLLYKIIEKHQPNALFNKDLYERYMTIKEGVPIFRRTPRYQEDNPINNQVNNDYFGQIVNAKVGCCAGNPFAYSYSVTDESEEDTGGSEAVEIASRTLTDFVKRNTMHKVDAQTTKNAAIYGYSGKLAYIDKELNERVKAIHGYETIALSDTSIAEPEYAIRYYQTLNLEGTAVWTVEFYDDKFITTYKGDLQALEFIESIPHGFDYCPLQGIANNEECMGDAEKVLALIDDYDKKVSDNSNELESFVHALMLTSILGEDVEETLKHATQSGILNIPPVGQQTSGTPVQYVTKNINDAFTEHHLERLESNIYMFSQTPDFNDESFGSASGVSLEHKFNGMKEKCTVFKANIQEAAMYMNKVICSSWRKKGINIDPIHINVDIEFNIPQDIETEARVVQTLLSAGLPKRYAFARLSDVDDVEWLMDLLKAEKEEAMEVESLYAPTTDQNQDEEEEEKKPDETDEEEEEQDS